MTPTEFALMVYLTKKEGQAVSREELLKHVWKFDFDVDTRATDDVIKRLRKKLNAAGADVKIQSVWGFGFRLEIGDAGEKYKE
jgi:DNA-binding response OmpR family regulator